MTWYQTRYALTRGIVPIEDGQYGGGNAYICHGKNGFDRIYVDIFATIEEAQEDQKMRARKAIVVAEKKIKKLKELL